MLALVKCRPVGTSANAIGTCRQPPVVGSQESMVQASPSSQLTGTDVQVGAPVNGSGWQVPPVVHRLPSSQTAPAGVGVETQGPPTHASAGQGLGSSQTSGGVRQAPGARGAAAAGRGGGA